MSTDLSFQDKTVQGTVPSNPEPGTDEPTLDPKDRGKFDPLERPGNVKEERPEDWKDPADKDLPEADEETPLSDDRR